MENNEIEQLLLKNLKLAKENNEYLKKIDGRQRFSRNIKLLYWAIIIGALVAGYFYAYPYVKEVQKTFLGTWDNISSIISQVPSGSQTKQ